MKIEVPVKTLDKIHDTYSADLITEKVSRIRTPVAFEGDLWVCTGSCGRGSNWDHVDAYRVKTLADWNRDTNNGPTAKYPTFDEGEARRNDPFGFYHATLVLCKGEKFVLCGPKYSFVPLATDDSVSDRVQTDKPQLSLF